MDAKDYKGFSPQLRKYLSNLETQLSSGYTSISDLSDLPTPVDGVITLEKDTNYNILSTIELGDVRITSPANSVNFFTSPNPITTGILRYTGTESMFTDDGNGRIWAFSLNGLQAPNGKIFDCGDLLGTAGNSIVFDLSVISDTDSIGDIKNYSFYTTRDLAQADCGQGLTLEDVNNVRIRGFQWSAGKNQVDSVALTVKGTTETLIISDGFVCSDTNEKILNLTGTIGSGVVSTLVYDCANGSFYETGSLDHTSPNLKFTGNSGITNSSVNGGMGYINNATETVISVADTPVKVSGTTVFNSLSERFTHTNGRLTYVGVEDTLAKITVGITVQGINNTNTNYKFYVAKNGTVVDNCLVERRVTTTNEIGGCTPLQAGVLLSKDDYIEVFVAADVINNSLIKHLSVCIEGAN